MLTKWLTDRPSRKEKNAYSFRPSLESLEERNAPSGGPNGAVNDQGSFNNTTITNSFNTTNTVTNNVTVNLMPGQATAVSGLLGVTGLLSSTLNNQQLGTLLADEVIAAVDSYLTMGPVATALGLSQSEVSTIKSDLMTLENTTIPGLLGTPPSPILSALGTEVFTMTLNALTSPQNTI